MARDEIKPGPGGGPELTKMMLLVTKEQREAIEKAAKAAGTTMSGVVRDLIDVVLLNERD